ncbi:histidinol-phosphate transaminase [Desertivibrio insolitus]|uniref:histidinol-phosphate transaminase n=1 Tax=Herbiconiux sp. SYSU D00978 TaxID=2812562 RepID=UPI0027DB9609|nr:histidinol-phosphate transaminase [Herbiconiux sp. SYSU D00978]
MTETTPHVRLRPEILALAAYRQGKPAAPDAFKLSSNENPYQPLPAVMEALSHSNVNRYPDGAATLLRERLAERHGVGAEQVHVGAGSISLLTQLVLAASGPGDEIVFSWRSFEAYPGLATVAGATAVRVPNTPEHAHDLDAMAAAITERTRVVIVCSPNNPTGTVVSQAAFDEFLAKVPPTVLVLLDEAYREFVTDPTAVDGHSMRHPNVVVLRTFSKAYGLAGLRIGYAVGPAYILNAARSTAIALSVTEPAQRAALVSLDHEDELLERVAALVETRDRVWQALVEQGWDVPKPQGNFVWLPTGDATEAAAEVFERHGIVVRAFAPEGLRISIGEPESVDALLRAAGEVVRNLLKRA